MAELEAGVDDVEAGGRQRGVEEVVDRQPAGVEDAGVLREVEVIEQRARRALPGTCLQRRTKVLDALGGEKGGGGEGHRTRVAPRQSYR